MCPGVDGTQGGERSQVSELPELFVARIVTLAFTIRGLSLKHALMSPLTVTSLCADIID